MPHNLDRTDRIVVHLPKQMTRLIEEYQIQLIGGTRSEAIRRLLQAGLEAEGVIEPKKKD